MAQPFTALPAEGFQPWTVFLRVAEQAYRRGTVFRSPIRGHRYQVATVTPRRVTISRLDANDPTVLTRARLEEVLQAIQDAGGRVPRRSQLYTVAQETALVELHPALAWDRTGDFIQIVDPTSAVEESIAGARPLKLYQDYSRLEAHDIFAPYEPYTPGAGTWGLQGIIPVPDRPGDFVVFVTFGKTQGSHTFDEGVTEDGVLTWQSQPSQRLDDAQIQSFIRHDDGIHSIFLFLRTSGDRDYTYLGPLRYLEHDPTREQPVYFTWQLLEGAPPRDIAQQMGLELEPPSAPTSRPQRARGELTLMAAPTGEMSRGPSRRTFKGRKQPDYAERDARNRQLGTAGELLALRKEIENLIADGRADLVHRVRHIAKIEGDGAGYDVISCTSEGEVKYIEVKTTRGPAPTAFFMSANELAFAEQHRGHYYLYRLYEYDEETESASYFVVEGDPRVHLGLEPMQYRVALKSAQAQA